MRSRDYHCPLATASLSTANPTMTHTAQKIPPRPSKNWRTPTSASATSAASVRPAARWPSRWTCCPTSSFGWCNAARSRKRPHSEAIWQCVSCLTCTTRCPKSVDCAAVMDALRQLAVEKDLVAPAMQRTVLFQQAFLRQHPPQRPAPRTVAGAEFQDLRVSARPERAAAVERRPARPANAQTGQVASRRQKASAISGVVERIFERCEQAVNEQ